MKSDEKVHWNIDTECIHAGQAPDPVFGAVAPPIYQTSTFVFKTPEEGAARFAGKDPGFIYTRMGNPTIAMLEANVAALEEAEFALATSSGMSAVSTLFFGLLSSGDHVVCSSSVYGPSRVVLERDFSRFGVNRKLVNRDRRQSTPGTRPAFAAVNRIPGGELTAQVKQVFIDEVFTQHANRASGIGQVASQRLPGLTIVVGDKNINSVVIATMAIKRNVASLVLES